MTETETELGRELRVYAGTPDATKIWEYLGKKEKRVLFGEYTEAGIEWCWGVGPGGYSCWKKVQEIDDGHGKTTPAPEPRVKALDASKFAELWLTHSHCQYPYPDFLRYLQRQVDLARESQDLAYD